MQLSIVATWVQSWIPRFDDAYIFGLPFYLFVWNWSILLTTFPLRFLATRSSLLTQPVTTLIIRPCPAPQRLKYYPFNLKISYNQPTNSLYQRYPNTNIPPIYYPVRPDNYHDVGVSLECSNITKNMQPSSKAFKSVKGPQRGKAYRTPTVIHFHTPFVRSFFSYVVLQLRFAE
jgi:hypothetical protein